MKINSYTEEQLLELQKAKTLLEGYCSRRESCIKDVQNYLVRKKVNADFHSPLIEHLLNHKWLDESRFIPLFIRAQARVGKSVRVISQKLKQKGLTLEETEITRIIEEATGVSELQRAHDFIVKKYPDYLSDLKIKQKAFQALVRRGYPFKIASKVVQIELQESD